MTSLRLSRSLSMTVMMMVVSRRTWAGTSKGKDSLKMGFRQLLMVTVFFFSTRLSFCISHNFYIWVCSQSENERPWVMQMRHAAIHAHVLYYTCTWGAPDVHGFEVASFYDVNSDGVGSGVITQRQQQISTTSLQHTHTQAWMRFERERFLRKITAIKVRPVYSHKALVKTYVCGAFPQIRFDCMDSDSRCHHCRVWGPSRTSSAVPAPLYSEEPRTSRSGRYGLNRS